MKGSKFFSAHKWKMLVVVLIMLVAVGINTLMGMRTVPSGYKGVTTQWGSITGETTEGLHIVNWIAGEDIVNVDIQIHKVNVTEQVGTVDMQPVIAKVSINYRLDSAFASDIYRTLRLDWERRVIVNNIPESLKAVTSNFKAEDFLKQREEIKLQFAELLKDRLSQYHIIVVDVQIEDWKFSDAFQAQVDANLLAEKQVLEEATKVNITRYQQEQALLTKQYEATMQKVQAEASANVTLTQANANAQALLIQAQAQSEALAKINSQLTEIYLKYMALQEWDGKLPYYYGSDAPIPFIEVP